MKKGRKEGGEGRGFICTGRFFAALISWCFWCSFVPSEICCKIKVATFILSLSPSLLLSAGVVTTCFYFLCSFGFLVPAFPRRVFNSFESKYAAHQSVAQ